MSCKPPERIEVDAEKLMAIVEQVKAYLSEEQLNILRAAIQTLTWLVIALAKKRVAVRSLRQFLFGGKTESAENVLGPKEKDGDRDGSTKGGANNAAAGAGSDASQPPAKPKRKGHGRNPAAAYKNAHRVPVAHASLKPGDACPECKAGKLYSLTPGQIVVVTGQAPLRATIFEPHRLRCVPCGEVFTATPPPAAQKDKYDAEAASVIALLKYGTGVPFNRQQQLSAQFGIPLPATTQWKVVNEAATRIEPAYAELIRQAAQGEVQHNDDTPAKILSLMGDDPSEHVADLDPERTGLFTSAVVSLVGAVRVALYFTGRRHAGENLALVMSRREQGLGAPIQMSDALMRNLPAAFATIIAHCLAHARRKFVDIVEVFPEACRFVIEKLGAVYHVDAEAKRRGLSAEQRLRLHKEQSEPIMDELKQWMQQQIAERLVEPNSPLGGAIAYMLTRWEQFTVFLRVAGAPLDNNIVERALKKAILHRKNSLFFKSLRGAHVSDVFMSLIHTAELAKVSAYDYLVALHKHADQVREQPARWMPWNYQATLAERAAPTKAAS